MSYVVIDLSSLIDLKLTSTIYQGRVVTQGAPRLHQCSHTDCGLRERCYCLYSRRTADRCHCQLDNHRKFVEEEQGLVQVTEGRRDPGSSFRYLY